MHAPVITLADTIGVLIGVVVIIFWIIGALSKLMGTVKKNETPSPPPSRSSTGGTPISTQVSAQDRLRTLSEQRRAQLQEIVRRRTGGSGSMPTAAPQTPVRIERAELDPRPRAADVTYRREIAEQLQQMQRANEQRQASAPAARQAAPRRSQPAAPPPSVRGKKLAPRQVKQQTEDVILEPDTIQTPLVARASIGITRKQGRVNLGDLTRDRLREAFVLKELLDKPLALREEGSGTAW